MKLNKGMSLAVVVRREWANLQGVRLFLRYGRPDREIGGPDDSHIIFAKLIEADDQLGLWIEGRKSDDSDEAEKYALFIPWSAVLTIAVSERFSAELRKEARTIGFATDTNPQER